MVITAADLASTNARPPADVLDHASADAHLARLRAEWATADPAARVTIARTAAAIKTLRPLLPERSAA